MITRAAFAEIDAIVRSAIENCLDRLREATPSNYLLFLAEGEYHDNRIAELNPYTIDNRMDFYMDESRLGFLSEFLTTFYSFPATQHSTDDREQRMHMELMVYTHIWESKPFLKKLFRLASIASGEQYPWSVDIPEMGKHTFIRSEIRGRFENTGDAMAGVIRSGFHTSLRNAFAHSEYSFDTMNQNRRIILHNYKGDDTWELCEISFDDWSRRFVYSALLSFYLYDLSHSKRRSIVEDMGSDVHTIAHPSRSSGIRIVPMRYIPATNSFRIERGSAG